MSSFSDMQYHILDEAAGNTDIPYIKELPAQLDMVNVIMGKPISIDLPLRLPVTIENETEVIYPDIMTADVPLFSTKLKTVLDHLNVQNIQYFPVELFNEASGQIVAKYHLAVVLNLIKCLKTGAETNSTGRRVIKNPVIDAALVGNHQLFRLYERPRLIIIDSLIKKSLEDIGLEGVSITQVEDYVSL